MLIYFLSAYKDLFFSSLSKISNGIALQWGSGNTVKQLYLDILLPIAFKNTNFFFSVFDVDTLIDTDLSAISEPIVAITSYKHTTNTKVRVVFSVFPGLFDWFALGVS